MMIEVIVKIDPETGRKIFNIDTGDMPVDQAIAFLKLVEQRIKRASLIRRPEGGFSFEERYWHGLIRDTDVPALVEGWKQVELAVQYRSEPPEYPVFVAVERRSR